MTVCCGHHKSDRPRVVATQNPEWQIMQQVNWRHQDWVSAAALKSQLLASWTGRDFSDRQTMVVCLANNNEHTMMREILYLLLLLPRRCGQCLEMLQGLYIFSNVIWMLATDSDLPGVYSVCLLYGAWDDRCGNCRVYGSQHSTSEIVKCQNIHTHTNTSSLYWRRHWYCP